MGCSAKAIADDEADHYDAMQRTGLQYDKKYGSIQVYSQDAHVVEKCADSKLSKDDTIKAIIYARHERLAAAEFSAEMKERQLFEELKSKY